MNYFIFLTNNGCGDYYHVEHHTIKANSLPEAVRALYLKKYPTGNIHKDDLDIIIMNNIDLWDICTEVDHINEVTHTYQASAKKEPPANIGERVTNSLAGFKINSQRHSKFTLSFLHETLGTEDFNDLVLNDLLDDGYLQESLGTEPRDFIIKDNPIMDKIFKAGFGWDNFPWIELKEYRIKLKEQLKHYPILPL